MHRDDVIMLDTTILGLIPSTVANTQFLVWRKIKRKTSELKQMLNLE